MTSCDQSLAAYWQLHPADHFWYGSLLELSEKLLLAQDWLSAPCDQFFADDWPLCPATQVFSYSNMVPLITYGAERETVLGAILPCYIFKLITKHR